MYNLTVPAAVLAVRKNLDEAGLNDSMMYAPPAGASEATDNNSLDDLIAKTIPEAINGVVAAAPAFMLEGIGPASATITDITDKVVTFTIGDEVLRLVALKAADTAEIVTDILAEASPEGRMQLNSAVRGTYDKPRLVQLSGSQNQPSFKYYSLAQTTEFDDQSFGEVFDTFYYIPVCRYATGSLYQGATSSDPAYYRVPHDLVDKILYRLTALVLAIYGENEKANYFNGIAAIG